jgi:hypothetical protein
MFRRVKECDAVVAVAWRQGLRALKRDLNRYWPVRVNFDVRHVMMDDSMTARARAHNCSRAVRGQQVD